MPDEEKLFKYFDGFSEVYGDPFEIDFRFDQVSHRPGVDLDLLNKWITDIPRTQDGEVDMEEFRGDQSRQRLYLEACHGYIPLIREAMELKPVDKVTGEGLPGEDVLRLWARYALWKAGVKKNTESPPLSPTRSTGSDPSSSPMGPSLPSQGPPPPPGGLESSNRGPVPLVANYSGVSLPRRSMASGSMLGGVMPSPSVPRSSVLSSS